jgi:hypothetical protein
LLEQAMRVLHFHASRKSVLEIEFIGEEGTGLGPTLEFYALVSRFCCFGLKCTYFLGGCGISTQIIGDVALR